MICLPDWDGMMETRYRMRECGYIAGEADALHIYDAFEKTCVRRRRAVVRNVAIDAFPVTNADFAAFLLDSCYRPIRAISSNTGSLAARRLRSQTHPPL